MGVLIIVVDNGGLEVKMVEIHWITQEQTGYSIQNFTFSESTEERKSYAFGKTDEKIIIV